MKNNNIKHIIVLPDGNRRWAKEKNKDFRYGYYKGYENMINLSKWLIKKNVPFLTIFGFSTENWKRPKDQVHYLMDLFEETLKKNLDMFQENKIKVNIIGNKNKLKKSLKKVIENIEETTKKNKKLTLNLAVNYGGKWDILEAFRNIIKSKKSLEEIDENMVNSFLSTKSCPEPELVIRTGGEKRISNFLIWQSTYSELFFIDKYWPSFKEKDLDGVFEEFKNRQRRFGGGE